MILETMIFSIAAIYGVEPVASQQVRGRYYCPGGEGCARGDFMDVTIEGLGELTAILGGFTDSFYGIIPEPPLVASGVVTDSETSCSQPGYLTDRRFEFAGDVPGLGPARLFLDPTRLSRGTVKPINMPQSFEELTPNTSVYPAVNEFRFYLRLNFPEFGDNGLQLVNRNPLTVRGQFDEWPPPLGTVYHLVEPVQFSERNPNTGEPVGPVLATLEMPSHACFYGAEAGAITTSIAQIGLNGAHALLEATVVSTVNTAAIWHAYSAGTILTLNPTPPPLGAPEFGPQAGRLNLVAGVPKQVQFSATFGQAGSEFVRFMVHADTGAGNDCMTRLSGSQNVVRVVRPNVGLSVDGVAELSYALLAGTTTEVTFTGTGFQQPVAIEFSGTGVTAQEVNIISPQEIRATIQVSTSAEPTTRNARFTSNGRQFLLAKSNDVIWPPPEVISVDPPVLFTSVPTELNITGKYFLPLSFVSLGPNVDVIDVSRISPTLLRARVVPRSPNTATAAGPADVVVVAANGASGINNAVSLETCGNRLCDIALGEGIEICPMDCIYDSDGDGDIDLSDVQRILNSLTGPRP